MKERPIIFSDAMVGAILRGDKTVTRRPDVKPWKKGDILWVREAWKADPAFGFTHNYRVSEVDENTNILYRATLDPEHPKYALGRWKPSIHMPRFASRIKLELVEDAYSERLQDISEEESVKEGIDFMDMNDAILSISDILSDENKLGSSQLQFRRLWSSIYGADSWNSNPYVSVIRFRRVE